MDVLVAERTLGSYMLLPLLLNMRSSGKAKSKVSTECASKLSLVLEPEAADLLSKCIRCLYAKSSDHFQTDGLPLSILHSHQCFIIKLIESKLLSQAFTELGWFHNRVLSITSNVSESEVVRPCLLSELLHGLPFAGTEKQSIQLAPVIVAHHLLLLQCLLQYCSRNVKKIYSGTDHIIMESHLSRVAALFLSTSDFCAWLAKAVEISPDSKERYRRNTLKVIRGFIKFLGHLAARLAEARASRSCLIIKAIEISQEVADVDKIAYDPSIDPYVKDLQTSCPDKARILDQLLKSSSPLFMKHSVSEAGILSCASRFAHQLDIECALEFKQLLKSCDPLSIDLTALLEVIQKIPDSAMESAPQPTVNFVSEVAKFLETSCLDSDELIKSHLITIDKLVFLSKDTPLSLVSTSVSSLGRLHNVLFDFAQWKRVRNIANSLYNLGSRHMCVEAWKLLVQYERDIYLQDISEANFAAVESKALYASKTLVQQGRPLEASVLLSLLLQTKDTHTSNRESLPYVLDMDAPLLVRIVTDCVVACPDSWSRVFESLTPSFSCLLTINILTLLDRTQNQTTRMNAANEISLRVQLDDPSLSAIVWYHYYQVSGLKSYLIIERKSGESLIEAGVLLWQSISSGWDDEKMDLCVAALETWLALDFNSSMVRYEQDIVGTMIQYLLYNDCNGLATRMIKLYKLTRSNIEPEYACLLQEGLCNSLARLRVLQDLSDELTAYSTLLKDNRITCLRRVVRFNMTQMRFCIASNALSPARQKFHKVLSVLQSRPEFSLDSNQGESLSDRFNNLAILAEFNYVSALLFFQSHDHQGAFSSAKLAVKLVSSIMKKILMISDNRTRHQLRWQLTPILVESYRLLLRITLHDGLSRDFKYYLLELNRLNQAIECPIVNCRINFDLAVFHDLLKDGSAVTGFLESAQQLYSYASVRESQCILRAHQQVQELFSGASILKFDFSSYASLRDVSANEVSQLHFLEYTTIADTAIQRPPSSGISDPSLLQSRLNILKIELEKALLAIADHNTHQATPRALPCVINDRGSDLAASDLDVLDRLVRCKESISKFVREECHAFSVFQSRIVTGLLTTCLQALSKLAVFKPQTNLLMELCFSHDRGRNHPFSFEGDASRNVRGATDLLPHISLAPNSPKADFDKLACEFYTDLNSALPKSWIAITIDKCPILRDLVLSRVCKDQPPFFVSIPLPLQFSGEGADFESITRKFNGIIDQLAMTTKASTTSRITTREQRKDWWKLRFSLDLRMQDLCNEIELEWLGGFCALFENFVEDDVYRSFRRDFSKLVAAHLSSGLEFDDSVVRLCYGVNSKLEESIHDICQFLFNSAPRPGNLAQTELRQSEYDFFYSSFRKLCHEYHRWRQTPNDDHIVLVLGSGCANLPWEALPCLESRSISRVPSIHLLLDLLKSRSSLLFDIQNQKGLYYMINPDGDLSRTEDKFRLVFSQDPRCHGLIRSKPHDEAVLLFEILRRDLFVYLGHGGCDQYLSASSLLKACLLQGKTAPPSLLIGCSSGAVEAHGLLAPSSNVFNWMVCGSQMLLANLWDVTDKDIDQFSQSVFEKWGLFGSSGQNNTSICAATQICRKECTLRYLNGASPVVYGLPMHFNSL